MKLNKTEIKARNYRLAHRLIRNFSLAGTIILTSLLGGMWGYHYFEKLNWLDSYVNAAMILSGMGPIAPPLTVGGKLFEGTYALFSGIIFLVTVGIIFAPILHRFLHKFRLEEENS